MIKTISIGEFLQLEHAPVLLDVRTPAEYLKAHIPGAKNLPIFSNEERVKIGTTYKQIGREDAILLGFEFVGPKWRGFIEKALEWAPEKKVVLHCWRGGMRSGAMAWALDFFGFEVSLIDGGYKSFRNRAIQHFEKKYNIFVLGGMTGSQKTLILKELKKLGELVIDLEGLAHHQGSVFGSMGVDDQFSQEQFENNLAIELSRINPNRQLWLEDESRFIGKNQVPPPLWKQMQNSKMLVEIQKTHEERISFLLQEYGVLDKNFLINATEHIKKRLGPVETKNAIQAINDDNLEDFIRIALVYYDKSYKKCLLKRSVETIFPLNVENLSPAKSAQKLQAFSKQILKQKTSV